MKEAESTGESSVSYEHRQHHTAAHRTIVSLQLSPLMGERAVPGEWCPGQKGDCSEWEVDGAGKALGGGHRA